MTENINITFLGTGSAIPTVRRSHPAVLLKYKDENILFDCGEGTQRQFRKAGINPCKVTKILITHWHADHVLGIPGLLQTMAMNGYTRKLEIYGPKGTKKMMADYMGLFIKKGNGFEIEVHEVSDEKFFENDEIILESSSMDHDCPVVGYSFTIKEKSRLDKDKLKKLKLPNSPLLAKLVKGESIEIDGKKIDGKDLTYSEPMRKVSFVIDTRYNNNALELAKDSDLLICESTYSKNEHEVAFEHAHMTSVEAAKIAEESDSKALALIHLSQRYEGIPKMILEEAKEVFENTIIPEDLDEIKL